MTLFRRYPLPLCVLLIVVGAFGVSLLGAHQVGTYRDDALYILLAQALARGQGFVEAWHPTPISHTAVPFGYPLLLAPLVRAFPDDFTVLQLLSLVLVLGSVCLTYVLFRRRLGTHLLFPALTVIALSPAIIGLSGQVMSEAPYLFLSLLAFVALDRDEQQGKKRIGPWFVVTVLAALGGYFVRAIGLTLLVTVIAWMLYRRRFKQAILFCALAITAIGLWGLRNMLVSGSVQGYPLGALTAAELQARLVAVRDNAAAYFIVYLPDVLVPLLGPRVESLFAAVGLSPIVMLSRVLILLVVVGGCLVKVRARGLEPFDLYLVLTVAALLALPAHYRTSRYLIPLLPFLYIYLTHALMWMNDRLALLLKRPRFGQAFGLAVLLVLAALNFGRDVQQVLNPVRYRLPDVSLGTVWIQENAPQDAVVMVERDQERSAALYTRRHVVCYPDTDDPVQVLQAIHALGVTHLLIAPPLEASYSQFEPTLSAYAGDVVLSAIGVHPSEFHMVYENIAHQVFVYEFED